MLGLRNPNSFRRFVREWNEQAGLPTPRLHRNLVAILQHHVDHGRRILLLVFRGAGKSTLVGLLCAWLLWQNPDRRILVVSADFALARKMVRNVKRVIERHPSTRDLRPGRADQWASDCFTIVRRAEWRDPSMLAKGIAANLTGSRADVVICDDVEVPNTASSEPARDELREQLGDIDYVIVPAGLQIYIGTPQARDTVYSIADDGFLAGFARVHVPVFDQRQRSRWPDRYTDAALEIQRRRSEARFASQMLLRPGNPTPERLNPDRLLRYDDDLIVVDANGQRTISIGAKRMIGVAAAWDPALGAPLRGHASVVAAVFVDAHDHYYLHRIRYLTHNPARLAHESEADQLCRQVAEFARDLDLPAVLVENNGIGRLLPGLLASAMRKAEMPCVVTEISQHRNKDERIAAAFDPVLESSRLHVHASVWDTPFVAELADWRPKANGRDDGIDAVATCLLAIPVRLPRLSPERRHDWRGHATPTRAITDFNL